MQKFVTSILILSLCCVSTLLGIEEDPIVLYRMGGDEYALSDGDEVGVTLINDDWDKSSSPRYIIAIRKSRSVIDTKDLNLFKSILKTLRNDVVVYEYGTCLVPQWYGINEKDMKAYHDAFKEVGVKVAETPRMWCYCKTCKGSEKATKAKEAQ